MNAWEQHANHGLQALGDAYQRGQLDLHEYRARRRRLLQGARERCLETQRHALVADDVAPVVRAGSASPRNWALVLIACGIIAVGLITWLLVLRGR